MNIETSYNFLKNSIKNCPKTAIILGSGLGEFSKIIRDKKIIPYSKIPGFLIPTVKGHNGQLILGTIHNQQIICAQGRFHLYEGIKLKDVVLPIHLFKKLGCENIFITNSSGCLQKNWKIGGFMHISSVIDFTFQDSTKPTKIKFNNSLNFESIKQFSIYNNIPIYEGCYSWTLGPTYETPSEGLMIKKYQPAYWLPQMEKIVQLDSY